MKTSSSPEVVNLPSRALLTIDEVADFFQVNRKTVYNWIDAGYIESRKLRHGRRIPSAEVIRIFVSSTAD